MPALSEANLEAPPTGADLRLMVRAVVAETPADESEDLKLTVATFDTTRLYVVPAGQWGGSPVVGDTVLLGFDETGDEWVVSGLPGPQGEPGEQGEQGDTGPTGPALNPTWTAWTPTLTNLTLGNGTKTGRYCQIGKVVHFRFWFKLGSTSAVASAPAFSLPVAAPALTAATEAIGIAEFYDSSAGDVFDGAAFLDSTTTARFFARGASLTYTQRANPTSTVPFTWATNDEIAVNGTYEAA